MAATNADVFVNPNGLFDRLVVFSADAVVIGNPEKPALVGLAAGYDAAWRAAAGPDATAIPYPQIRKVRTNQHGEVLNLHWRDASRDRLTSVHFEHAAARDRAWAALHRRLGAGFSHSDQQFGRVRALVAPLVTVAIIVAMTWLFRGAADALAGGAAAEVRGRNAMLKRLAVATIDILGPAGVVAVGSLAVVLALAWAAARVRTPPRMLTLVRL